MTLTHARRRPLLAVLAMLAALAISACGGSDDAAAGNAGNGTDRAFVGEMVAHHRSAVDMAKIALQRGRHAEINSLADDIIASQSAEIEQMDKAKSALDDDGVKPGKLESSMDMDRMTMDTAMLKTAKPFDREFIDMMIPHHQDAIRMARTELDKGASGELKTLAQAVVAAQSREIKRMNTWRSKWYGAPSPAGGVPAETS